MTCSSSTIMAAAFNGSESFAMITIDGMQRDNSHYNSSSSNDDERDLLWASIERLPSRKRPYFALLNNNNNKITSSDQDLDDHNEKTTMAETTVVDVRKLDRSRRELVVKRAFATNEQDNYKLLSAIKHRLDRVGLDVAKVEVRFEKLAIGANVQTETRALPTLVNFYRDIVETILTSLKILQPERRSLTILDDKSGKITYNGHTIDKFCVLRSSAYISQSDNLIAELTVRETLDYAARFQGASDGFAGFLKDLSRLEKQQNIHPSPEIDAFMKASSVSGTKHNLATDYILKVLGLDVCADTIVGSEMIRGVSGGQRKRVTTGEMIVGPRKTLFMDEISTGLDSSTTYQIVKCIRNFVHLMEGTVLMALLQPAPETFDLFDDVMLLSEGHMVYQGPRENVVDFFESLGFKLPPRKGIADFLQEVTSKKDQAQYWADNSRPYKFLSVQEISDAFKNSIYGNHVMSSLSVPYDETKSHPSILSEDEFAVSKWELFKACFAQEALLINRNRFLYVFRTCQVAFVGFVTCTMFLRSRSSQRDEANANLDLACLFFGLIHMMFNGFSELSIMISRLPVFYKQRDNHFHPAWAWSIPNWILRVPYSAIEAIAWSCIVYYTVGFAPGAGRRYVRNLLKPKLPKKGMILPFEPLSMTFHNVNYFVDMSKENDYNSCPMSMEYSHQEFLQPWLAPVELEKQLLWMYSPGVLTALVGSSGAGKTTLMDVLAGRKTGGYIEGDIKISGYPKEQRTFARISGYVEQNDIHSPQLTVEESLLFSSWLRLPKDISEESKNEFVKEVMRLVELDTMRNALVGLPGSSGLSTEQRKRLTIAVELVANPSIIFMDEPTSGLDARAAAIVMRTVRNTVDTGRTVVCTIHQPSIDIFEAFDERIEGIPRILDGYNPATWMLEVTTKAVEQRIGQDFAEIYKNSNQFREVKAQIKQLSIPLDGSKPLKFSSTYSQYRLSQLKLCLWKQNLVYWRSPHYNSVRLFFSTMSAVIIGSVFWNIGSKRNTPQDLMAVMGALYAACLFLGVSNASSVQPVIAVERTVYYREKAAGMYSSFPYAAAQNIPGWWIWFYYISPVAWTLRGIITSQLGDVQDHIVGPGFDGTVKEYIEKNLGYGPGMIGVNALVLVVFAALFFTVYAFSIRVLNFQKR
ncbi:hypothetical protein Sjap_000274 [Stephania japonica]|uniref:ABC transporter domain-containing protein n=1 Tax=Stephania japonica TaxID=461633 RepID=A0AAP0KJJ3_9MAGN